MCISICLPSTHFSIIFLQVLCIEVPLSRQSVWIVNIISTLPLNTQAGFCQTLLLHF
ncbi:hypothetical protein M758_12G128900 [Ceratodon purpureus]|nr:hypothetical protein M758_12G128900 [Ceratodon purpureus]